MDAEKTKISITKRKKEREKHVGRSVYVCTPCRREAGRSKWRRICRVASIQRPRPDLASTKRSPNLRTPTPTKLTPRKQFVVTTMISALRRGIDGEEEEEKRRFPWNKMERRSGGEFLPSLLFSFSLLPNKKPQQRIRFRNPEHTLTRWVAPVFALVLDSSWTVGMEFGSVRPANGHDWFYASERKFWYIRSNWNLA